MITPESPSPSIRVSALRHRYGSKEVLTGVDLTIPAGTVFGYIGPNGAGKSTTVKILTGLLPGWEGAVEVCGHDVRRSPLEVKARIGYVPENAILYEQLTVGELLELVGRLHRVPTDLAERRIREILGGFGLEERLGTRIQALSKGLRQKVLITSALLHDPELIFLDEPLSGLDVDSARLVKDLIRGLADSGRTVFYCSHDMDVVEKVCDRIAIVSEGRIIADGAPRELTEAAEQGDLEAVFSLLTRGKDAARDTRARVERILGSLAP
ncbi:MAG: ABC transporter ATP-binding protein [Planctomycetota bacterium]|jgi:ABC-2 type transport system ATP-binding protein